jgi:hypothetical protein
MIVSNASRTPEQPLLAVEWWNAYFSTAGGWENNRGRLQTRLFAEAFCNRSRLERAAAWTILDSSCALGDAMPVLRSHFPNATLFGSDFSDVAITRCREQYGDLAGYCVRRLDEIEGMYDVIYSSATLEHFVNSDDLAGHLLAHCRHLAILVPYNEQRHGTDLDLLPPDQDHVRTFREHSFDFLIEEGRAARIHRPEIFRVPGAWSWTARQRLAQAAKNAARLLLGRPLVREKWMILFEIDSANAHAASGPAPLHHDHEVAATRHPSAEQVPV